MMSLHPGGPNTHSLEILHFEGKADFLTLSFQCDRSKGVEMTTAFICGYYYMGYREKLHWSLYISEVLCWIELPALVPLSALPNITGL